MVEKSMYKRKTVEVRDTLINTRTLKQALIHNE